MLLQTVLHRRFRGDSGPEFVYLANSAAILGLDPFASDVVGVEPGMLVIAAMPEQMRATQTSNSRS